jgi:mevalonate kinase
MSEDEEKEELNSSNNNIAVALRGVQHERIGKRVLQRTRAYGKLILFGEHFVVYNNVPALVGAVAAYTDCECEVLLSGSSSSSSLEESSSLDKSAAGGGGGVLLLGPGMTVVDNRPAVENYKLQKREEGDAAIQLVLRHFGLDIEKEHHVKLTFGGDLTCVSGIGASAAQVVSLARALSYELRKSLTEDEINAAGYEGEKGYHGMYVLLLVLFVLFVVFVIGVAVVMKSSS